MIGQLRTHWIIHHPETWWERLIRVALIVLSAVPGAVWLVGSSKWHASKAYIYINNLHVPWQAWGLIFLLQAALIAAPFKLRLAGYIAGFVTTGYFGLMLTASAINGYSSSPLACSALLGYSAIHLAGTRDFIFRRIESIERDAATCTIGDPSAVRP